MLASSEICGAYEDKTRQDKTYLDDFTSPLKLLRRQEPRKISQPQSPTYHLLRMLHCRGEIHVGFRIIHISRILRIQRGRLTIHTFSKQKFRANIKRKTIQKRKQLCRRNPAVLTNFWERFEENIEMSISGVKIADLVACELGLELVPVMHPRFALGGKNSIA
jgi:hypothetical protein